MATCREGDGMLKPADALFILVLPTAGLVLDATPLGW
jgi:hypothetical protein